MSVQAIDLDDGPVGEPFVAVDSVQAGPGDRVLVCSEGGSANLVLGTEKAPVAAVIVGIVYRITVRRNDNDKEMDA